MSINLSEFLIWKTFFPDESFIQDVCDVCDVCSDCDILKELGHDTLNKLLLPKSNNRLIGKMQPNDLTFFSLNKGGVCHHIKPVPI